MIVLILQVPEAATHKSICNFVETALRRVWLLPIFRKGLLESCEIRRIRDPGSGGIEYQALVYVDDDRTGEALIKQLNGKTLDGAGVRARVYHQRSVRKDRRVNLSDSHNIAIVDRRRADRRRSGLVVETVHNALTAVGGHG